MNRRLLFLLAVAAFLTPSILMLAQAGFVVPTPVVVVPRETGPTDKDNGGTLRGIVVREGTNEPIRNVQIAVGAGAIEGQSLQTIITLNGRGFAVAEEIAAQVQNAGRPTPTGPFYAAITDADGRFEIENIPAGDYPLSAKAAGYFGPTTTGIAINIARARATIVSRETTQLTIGMLPGGTVSGQVLDPDRKPVTNGAVEIFRLVYPNGLRTLQLAAQEQSNDRGEYRLFNIAPGDYYLAANPRTIGLQPLTPETLMETFYPGMTEWTAASRITVLAGGDNSGLNIPMRRAATVNVSGRVVNQVPPTDPPTANTATVTLLQRDQAKGNVPRTSPNVTVTDGKFTLTNIPPGSYELFASVPSPGDFSGGGPQPGGPRGLGYGRTSIEVLDKNIENTQIVSHPGHDIKGQVLVDGKPANANLQLQLQPTDSAIAFPLFVFVSRFRPAIDADGNFTFVRIPEAHYQIRAELSDTTLPKTSYVADIRQGAASVYDNGIDVGNNAPAPIQVLVNTNGGAVQGTVENATIHTTVVLVPAQNRRTNPALYKAAPVDKKGSFAFEAIPPGKYNLFAWDGVVTDMWLDPLFLKRFENRGTSVTIGAGERVSQTIRLIR